jgi:hypothetical protein
MTARALRKIAFIVEEFALQTPAQQLLDRVLIGYPHEGAFRQLEGCRVAIYCSPAGAPGAEITRRVEDFGLVRESSLERAVADADAVVVAGREQACAPAEVLLTGALENSAANSACFVYGALAATLEKAKAVTELAASRHILLAAGTATAVTYRLPDVEVPAGIALKEALVVAQGEYPVAEVEALHALLPVIERRRNGESGVKRIRFLQGQDIWRAGDRGVWPRSLLASALSRSDRPQGDPVADGRTQDLLGLDLIPHLARQSRCWILEHRDGLRSTLLDLDGVVGDLNFAVQTDTRQIISAQLHRPPGPAQHEFSRLAAVLEGFFRTGQAPWPMQRSLLVAGLLDVFGQSLAKKGKLFETPDLGSPEIAYHIPDTTRR